MPKNVDYYFWPNLMMKEKGFDATILTRRLPGTKKEETVNGVKIKRFASTLPLLLDLRLSNPDLTHSHTFGWAPSMLSTIFCKRCVYTPHVYTIETSRKFLGARIYLTKKAKRIINLTNFERNNFIEHGFDPKRLVVLPHPIDYKFMSKPYGGEKIRKKYKGSIVISVANYGPRKNLDTLIRAMASVKKEVKDAELLIIGRDAHGDYKQVLQEVAHKSGIGNSVHFLDWLSHKDVINYLDAADLFALPSKIEGQCIAACEAAAAGVPLVLSDIKPLYEIFKNCALFSKPEDVKKLADNIITGLTDDKKRQKLIQTGKKEMKEFDIPKIRKRQYELYKEVLEE